MPVRMLNFLTSAPPPRASQHRLAKTPEYQDTLLALGAGLKPQEFIEVYFPPEHEIYKRLKHPLNSLRLAIALKVKELHLPYDVYERGGKVYIVGRGVNES